MSLRNHDAYRDFNCFFVTTVCKEHLHLLRSERCKVIVSASMLYVSEKYDMKILGYVIMPNHLHSIFYFVNNNRLSDCMRDLKKYTAFEIRREIEKVDEPMFDKLRYQHREQLFKVWNDRFDRTMVTSRESAERILNYIHLNPLQEHWNLCQSPEEYRYSSASFYGDAEQGPVIVTDYREYF